MKKYRNFETSFRSLKIALSEYLKKNVLYYEVSEASPYGSWHFEILCDDEEANDINCFLDSQSI